MKLFKLFIFILLLVLFAGCKEEAVYRINFYHFLHVEEHEIDCTMCHGELEDGMFASADMEACSECHEDEVDADEINSETCGKCHLQKDLEEIEGPDYERPTKGVFRHTEGLSGLCRKCHADTVKEGSTKVAFWPREDVIKIRNRAHALGLDCQTCHEKINKDTPWDTHKTNWIKRHGMFAAEEKPLCTQCHKQAVCRECHQQQPPSSHINLWRAQTHGIEASWNRENCQLCHQNDFCVSCHTNTKPLSHTATWNSPSNRHCFNCHFSLAECTICHSSGSASEIHDAYAPMIPALPHSPNNTCLDTCHEVGGANGTPDVWLPKASHDIFDNSVCLTCHQR